MVRPDDSLSHGGRALAPRLAVVLQRRPDAAHAYHFRLTYYVPDGDAPSAAPARRSAERRVAALAGALFTAGCPAPAITVAVEPIAAASASMRYRLSLERTETAGSED